ncbi:MAG TPA: sulfatase-like hydrolase/transferase [Steroidobacteraceae bacterium]|nr:sulfatase-like hydrolase/transferase [Steroidobacteraceae bacterium]
MARFERRAFMSMMGKMAVALPFARVGAGAQSAPRAQPNILFILADDLGYADLSSYGRRDIATPNIDRIGIEGVRFLQAYANSAVCSATRTALITGRYQYRLRLGLEEPARDVPDIGLPPEHPTLPSLLKKAGYRTALVGKWHLGSLPKFGPLQSGYEQFYGFRGGGVDYYTHANGSRKDFWDGDTPIEKQGYLTDLLGERTIELIDAFAKGKAPYFISLHFNAPHWPWEPPGDDSESKRLHGRNLMHMDGGSLAIYKQMVERMDYQVGRVLAALDAHGLRDDTIVIFTSDNGGERFSDTWPFTGKKSELLEGGVRVPAMVRWPRRVAPGRTHDQVTISMDWLPTLLAAAGTAPDPAYPTDGMSLMPVLTQNAPAVPRKLFWRYKANAQRSARDGDFKILKIQNHTFLFNVVEDPLERANLRERRRDIYDRMVREWNEWNATMLPETRDSATYNWSGADIADHFGSEPATGEVDDVSVWPDARASAPGSK